MTARVLTHQMSLKFPKYFKLDIRNPNSYKQLMILIICVGLPGGKGVCLQKRKKKEKKNSTTETYLQI